MPEIKSLISQDTIMKTLGTLYEKSLHGIPKVSPPIKQFAEDYLSKEGDPQKAAKAMIKNQVIKCATSGFVTGFGGLITLPVSIPANLGSVMYVQMRMITCVAYLAGYDLQSDQLQTLVYACLAGVSVNSIIKQTGVKFGTKVATVAIKKIPGAALIRINQGVGFRLVTKFGQKGLVNLGKLVPGVGAAVSGGMDFAETKLIGDRAYKMFFEGDFSADDKEVIENDATAEQDKGIKERIKSHMPSRIGFKLKK